MRATETGSWPIVAWALSALALACTHTQSIESVTLLATGDTQGKISPCNTCGGERRLGGLARRATLVDDARAASPTLLVDAGNALLGTESFASAGAVIAVAYEALCYDAVNLGYRDFRLGKQATLDALSVADIPAVSANLYHAGGEERLFAPFVVVERGGRNWAFVGVTEPPANWRDIPHLARQLDGVHVHPAREALSAVLPDAGAASDEVVLLHYGSAVGARRLADEFVGTSVLCVVTAGDLPIAEWPVVSTYEQGKRLTRLVLGPEGVAVEVPIDLVPEIMPSALLQAAIAPFLAPPPHPEDEQAQLERVRKTASEQLVGDDAE